jgi:outer membrane protein
MGSQAGKVSSAIRRSGFGLSKAALACGAALVFAATPAMAETLTEAMALAYDTNPNLRAARAQLRATDENVAIAMSGWRPTIIINGNATRQGTKTVNPSGVIAGGGTTIGGATTVPTVTGSRTLTYEQLSATITQPIFRGFKTVAGVAQAKNQVKAERARLQATEAQVLLQVATVYNDVLEAKALVDLNQNQAQVFKRQLEATQDRFRVGELTRTDVSQAEASLSGAKAALVQAQGRLEQARASYLNTVGKAPENLENPALPQNLPGSEAEAVDRAIKINPTYLAADFTARAADENIRVVQGDLLPSVDLIGQVARGWNTISKSSTVDVWSGGAQVTVPIYQSGAEWARLRQAKSLYGQARLQSDQARRDARTQAIASWNTLQATIAADSSIEAQIKANEIATEGVAREAEVGSRTVIDLLISQQTLLSSQVSAVQNRHDQQVAAYQLLAATGRLTAGDLGLGVSIFDAEEHYKNVRSQPIGWNSEANADGRLKGEP